MSFSMAMRIQIWCKERVEICIRNLPLKMWPLPTTPHWSGNRDPFDILSFTSGMGRVILIVMVIALMSQLCSVGPENRPKVCTIQTGTQCML